MSAATAFRSLYRSSSARRRKRQAGVRAVGVQERAHGGPGGSTVSVFGLTFDMEDVLVRGVFNGYSRYRGVRLGTVDIDWVYNPMPPKQGQVYPAVELRPVTEF